MCFHQAVFRRVCQHYLPIDSRRERNTPVSLVLALKLWSHCENRFKDVTIKFFEKKHADDILFLRDGVGSCTPLVCRPPELRVLVCECSRPRLHCRCLQVSLTWLLEVVTADCRAWRKSIFCLFQSRPCWKQSQLEDSHKTEGPGHPLP